MVQPRLVKQLVDLQNRITELSEKGRLDELTHGEVALLSYAHGSFTASILKEPSPPNLDGAFKSLAAMRRAAKKAGVL